MFENQTYQVILTRMLDKVDLWARECRITIDTREGSLIRTALSPAALELQQAYMELDEVLNESFADTQTRDFLIRRCKERGIAVEGATMAVRMGAFNIPVPVGARFSLNKLNYIVSEVIGGNLFRLCCETAGVIGNIESGDMIPIDYIDGLTSAVLTEVLIPGEDEEGTEHLRARYFSSLKSQAFGGNIQDYVEKTLSLNGVGGVKIYSAWNGGGSVKVVLLSSELKVPSATLVEAVQVLLDPIPNSGRGLGIAPIGHVVTVEGASDEAINVTTRLTLESDWDWEAVKPYVEQVIDGYFSELAAQWDGVDWRNNADSTLIVRISQIETRLLTVTGIIDVAETMLNGQPLNHAVGVNAIPIRGTVANV